MTTVQDLERLMAPDGRRFYGVVLSAIGDDGDWIVAAGHIEPRRMAGAVEAYARAAGLGSLRNIDGSVPGDDEYHPLTTALGLIHHGMAAVHQPYCTHGGHDEGDACLAPSADWALDWSEGEPGRDVPVTILEWTQ